MWLNRHGIGALGVLTLAAIGAIAVHTGAATTPASKGAVVTPAFAYDLPHLPGQKLTGAVVAYPPGTNSPPHHHTAEGVVVAYVLEGAIRSRVNEGPEKVYRAGESWLEPPGAAHAVSANASATEPARLLAIFVAADGAELTTFDQ